MFALTPLIVTLRVHWLLQPTHSAFTVRYEMNRLCVIQVALGLQSCWEVSMHPESPRHTVSCIGYINRLMPAIKHTSQNAIHGVNSYMFRHRTAVFRKSTKTSNRCNTPTRALTSLTVTITTDTKVRRFPWFPNCFCRLLMQPSRFKYIAFNLLAEQKKVTVLNLQIMPFSINEKLKFGHPYCTLLLSAFYRLIHTFSFSFYSYQKDERAKRWYRLKCCDPFPTYKCVSNRRLAFHFFFLSLTWSSEV